MRVTKHFFIRALFAAYLIATFHGCAHNPYAKTNKKYKKHARALSGSLAPVPPVMVMDSAVTPAYAVGTTNFDLRKPNFVIIHHTAQQSCAQTLRTFTVEHSKVSAHYVICKDGTIHHMLNDYLRAWQAGASKWGNFTDINSSSIGIELDNNGYEPFSVPLITSLLQLLDTLKRKYNLPATNFIGHSDIAPGRKVDPNKWFPWQLLAERGYGMWYDTTGVSVPDNFNAIQALRIIWYNIKDTTLAIKSFKLHFIQDDSTRFLDPADRKILYDLSKKYE
jgi:N-acetylmuramoyl-L-alanine amidase